MTDFAMSIFQLGNKKGLAAPAVHFGYLEEDTGAEWRIECAGTRIYLVRFRHEGLERNFADQAADSHFIVRRLVASLFVAGAGLFLPTAAGRILFEDVEGDVTWHCDMGIAVGTEVDTKVFDWFQALSHHTVLKRAGEDAYAALASPTESFFYIYRGFEWLHTGLDMSWEEIAGLLDVPVANIKEMHKTANYESGVRHASRSGVRRRANPLDATWIGGLLECINAARVRLEPEFVPMTPDEVADAVLRAAYRAYD